jgi:membrane-bound lytic murein transglycosylase A
MWFADIPGWRDDDHAAALAAFRVGTRALLARPPKTRRLGISGRGLQRAAEIAAALPAEVGLDAARGFFEANFAPFGILGAGFVTGYFEPDVAASLSRSSRFSVPLYRRPPDLIEIGNGEAPADWDPALRFARATSRGLEPYFDRAAIEQGALAGRGLELAWIEDPVDAFFIHVQGSARLRLSDGATMRVAYDGKSGHPYTSIGKLAVERGILTNEHADKEGLEAWLKAHRGEGRALMQENRSFIFFRETPLGDEEGPLGAAGVPLTAGRSLAVDRTLHTFHTPVWVDAPDLPDMSDATRAFRRLMIAQDTGSAIIGAGRGDVFFGSGADAGFAAGRVRHAATMIVLVPRSEDSDLSWPAD